MKSANWISATGRRPLTAAPIDAPTIIDSVSGVSMTRSSPNSAHRPSVARKTPPFLPTSSPRTMTDSSRRISSASVSRMASMNVRGGISRAQRPPARRRRRSASRRRDRGRARARRTRSRPRRRRRCRRVRRASISSVRTPASRSWRGSAAARRAPRLGASSSSERYFVCWSSDEWPVRRVTLASISVGPSPARARATASARGRIAGEHVRSRRRRRPGCRSRRPARRRRGRTPASPPGR